MFDERVPLIFPLSQKPEWRADPCALTFLKTPYEGQFAAKQWMCGTQKPVTYSRTRLWRPFVARADGIQTLSHVLLRAARILAD